MKVDEYIVVGTGVYNVFLCLCTYVLVGIPIKI